MAKLPQGMRKTTKKGVQYFEMRFTVNGKRYSASARSVEECKKKADALMDGIEEREMLRGTPGNQTLNCYRASRLEAWRRSVTKARALNEEYLYVKAAETIADQAGTKLGELKLREVQRRHLEKVQGILAEKYSPATVNQCMHAINGILRRAVEDGIIDRHPAAGFRKLKETEKPARETIHRALTLEETEKFFAAAEELKSWYLPLYEFLLNTGCRIGEAGALLPSDITREADGSLMIQIERSLTKNDIGSPMIGNTTKTPTSKRSLHLNEDAKAALTRQKRLDAEIFDGNVVRIGESEEPIFRSPYGKLLTAGNIHLDLERICKKAGIEHFSVHAFRDTFATRAIESGMNPKTLQKILGHSKIAVTMDIYAQVMEETTKTQMAAVVTRKAKEA